MLALLVTLIAPSTAGARGRIDRLGAGASTVWILWPDVRPTTIVVFGHGWSTPEPSGFGPWIAHLRARGAIVMYPKFVVPGETATGALIAFESALRTGFTRLAHVHLPVVAVGKSFGGSAVFYYATAAKAWHVPAPRAIMSVFPALPINGLPAGRPARQTFVEILVGDADTIAGSAGADAFWGWLGGHPATEKRYVVVHSRPGWAADHESAQRSDRIARSVFWARLDRLIARPY